MSDSDLGTRRVGATLLLLGTFVLGMIAGGALLQIARLSFRPPPGPRGGPFAGEPPLEHLQRTLALTAAQTDQLREIFEQSRGRMKAEGDATRDRILEILTPEQRDRFKAMRPPPPHPPPGGPPRGFPPGPPPDGPPPEGPPPPPPEP